MSDSNKQKAKPAYEQLEAFYHAVAQLTVNHDSLTIPNRDDPDSDEDYAVVYPNKLSVELEKVDPDWYENA